MDNLKKKSQVFIVGVMVGLIIAGGFFILKLDDYFKELNFYKKVAETFSSASKNNEVPVKLDDIASSKEKKENDNKTKIKKTSTGNSDIKTDYVLDADTLNAHSIKDSLRTENSNPDDIVVRKDELLFTKTLEIFNLSPVASNVNPKDSLLQKVSGVNDDRMNTKQFLNMEFWHSPLNYKGYKMSKYKLVLYGITSSDGIKLYKLEDVIYLKNSGMVYRLDYASDFKPYERITDESIINKLK